MKIYKGTADEVDVDVHSSGDFRAEGRHHPLARQVTEADSFSMAAE